MIKSQPKIERSLKNSTIIPINKGNKTSPKFGVNPNTLVRVNPVEIVVFWNITYKPTKRTIIPPKNVSMFPLGGSV